jgi:hypothetical protein
MLLYCTSASSRYNLAELDWGPSVGAGHVRGGYRMATIDILCPGEAALNRGRHAWLLLHPSV